MTGLPTIQVLLDDASGGGTWPYNISAYALGTDGYTITRGRSDEVGDVDPSTLSMMLNNTDGRFTLGSTVGGYGTINTDRRIQVKHTVSGVTTTRFTGYVQDWPVEWPGGTSSFAVASITAVDRLARLNRRTLRSIIEQEYLLDTPSAYYTLGEPAGSTSVADSSGKVGLVNLSLSGSGTTVTFGSAIGPGTDGLTAAQFTNGGKGLQGISQPALATGASAVTLECFFSATATGVSGGLLVDAITAQLGIDASGNLFFQASPGGVATSSPSYLDGATHHVIGYYTGSNMVLYVDGVSAATNAASGTMTVYPINGVGVSGASGTFVTGPRGGTITGTISHAAQDLTVPSPTRIAAHANAGLNGFNTERSDQRIARYAAYANIPTADQTLETGVQTNVPHIEITGMSPTAAMQEIVNSEDGLLFLRGDGKLILQNRTHRAAQTTPILTMTASTALGPGDRFTGDMQHIVNTATVTRDSGAGGYAENAASILAHEQYPVSLNLKVATDAEAVDRANWEANTYPEPLRRLGGLTLNLFGMSAATQQSVQALELSDRIQITSLPTQAGSTADLVVEGWTERVSTTEWTMTCNVSPWSPNAVWILGNATYGVLDSTTRLGL